MAKSKSPANKDGKAKMTSAERNSVLKDNYQLINDFQGVQTSIMHVREQGCIVREVSKSGVSSVWVPNVKPKKKGVNYVLIQDTPEQRASKKEKRDAKKAAGGGKKKK